MCRRRSAASSMIGGEIVSVGLPDRLVVAPLAEKADPDHKITAIGPQAVRRTYAHGRADAKKPVEIEIVMSIVMQDEWHALTQTGLVRRRDRGGGQGQKCTVRHHCGPAESAKCGEIELGDGKAPCGGSRTGGLKPASARATTSLRRPNQNLIRSSVAL